MSYDVTGTFNAIDNISSISNNIGSNIASMAQNGINSLQSLQTNGFDAAALGSAAMSAGLSGVIAVASEAIDSMISMDTTMNKMSATTGFTADNIDAMKKNAEDLFNTGLTSNFEDAAKAAAMMYSQVRNIDMSSDSGKKFGEDAMAMSAAWGVSAEKIMDTVGNMQDRFADFNKTPKEALDTLVLAAQYSNKPLQEIMKTVNSFGPIFATAGLNGQDMMQLITTATENGVDNVSALSKTVDTFHQRLAKPPPGFQSAMYELGLGKVAYEVRNNKTTMTAALDQVYTALAKMPDGVNKTNAAMAIFGKSFDKLDPKALAGFSKEFADMGLDGTSAADQVADAMNNNLGTALQKLGNNIKTGLGDGAEWVYQRLRQIDWQKIGDSISAAFEWAKQKVTAVAASISLAVNTAMTNATQFINSGKILIQTAINGITAGISATWNDWFGAAGKIPTLVNTALTTATGYFNGAKTTIGTAIGGIIGGITPLTDQVSTVFGGLGGIITGSQQGISTAVSGITNGVSTVWSATFGPGGSLGKGVSTALNLIAPAITGIQDSITSAISGITSAVDSIWNQVFGTSGSITTTVNTALQSVVDAANGIIGSISAAFSGITNAIKGALQGAVDFVGKLADGVRWLMGVGGGGGGQGGGGNAMGGMIPKGLSMVGEQGPEMVFSSGNGIARVFSNSQTMSMAGSGVGQGGGVNITISAGNVVGSNGMQEFARTLYQHLQNEDYRRGKRQ